jgi:hypothetical protein
VLGERSHAWATVTRSVDRWPGSDLAIRALLRANASTTSCSVGLLWPSELDGEAQCVAPATKTSGAATRW